MMFGQTSPYYKEFLCKPTIPIVETKVPDMGLPTQADPNVKLSGFQMMKERNRLVKIGQDRTKWKYAIECVGTLGQAIQVTKENEEGKEEVHNSIYATEDSGIGLSQKEQLLFKPAPEYLKKVFDMAHKPRAYVPYIKGLMNYASAHEDFAAQLFQLV